MDKKRIEITLHQQEGYAFRIEFGDGIEDLLSDEPAPLGSGYAALLDNRLESFETQIQHRDGSLRSAVLHKATYSDVQGQKAGIVGVIYDISDRKKAENDLRAAEEKYREIFENSALGIFRTAPDGTWLVVNPSMARMLGVAESAMKNNFKEALSHLQFTGGVAFAEIMQLAERLPSFLVPGMILMRESLPLTSSGKVDRKIMLFTLTFNCNIIFW